ncbi:uncharacterized protein LOC125685454 [Lagopus muta]|uniref:uncharacterized protein LOC125685454 n=1 Tax=Lagopus muta TaxID=64668 RepID=UPI0020A06F9F|nr:uncharacterized protein LOC125685454 [Lagopus muta]
METQPRMRCRRGDGFRRRHEGGRAVAWQRSPHARPEVRGGDHGQPHEDALRHVRHPAVCCTDRVCDGSACAGSGRHQSVSEDSFFMDPFQKEIFGIEAVEERVKPGAVPVERTSGTELPHHCLSKETDAVPIPALHMERCVGFTPELMSVSTCLLHLNTCLSLPDISPLVLHSYILAVLASFPRRKDWSSLSTSPLEEELQKIPDPVSNMCLADGVFGRSVAWNATSMEASFVAVDSESDFSPCAHDGTRLVQAIRCRPKRPVCSGTASCILPSTSQALCKTQVCELGLELMVQICLCSWVRK